mmetsp:Transcript_9592/g.20909  ORF Transcript_9592/g.20909 Transcript_9592/m.20909 type:complete len:234 (+) Transcript_9592:388-1089(+)
MNMSSAESSCSGPKLGRLGRTAPSRSGSSPNHSASPAQTPSHGSVGSTRPRPSTSRSPTPSSSEAGNLPRSWPPRTEPPTTKWFDPQPWSEPAPLEVRVRPNSLAESSTTSSHTSRPRISATNLASAVSTSAIAASSGARSSPCMSKPPSETKKASRSVPVCPLVATRRETCCSWRASPTEPLQSWVSCTSASCSPRPSVLAREACSSRWNVSPKPEPTSYLVRFSIRPESRA